MKVSAWGIEVLKAFEGFSATPYLCPAGVLTQGYGHTAAAGPPKLGGSWSKDYAAQVLTETVTLRYGDPVMKALRRTPTQAQFDAMVSLAYNIGLGWEGPVRPKGAKNGFRQSSVLRLFNAGDDEGAAKAFALWNKGGGKVLSGLVRRRATEALMYRGIKDLDFDGRHDLDEPVYGPMPQDVEGDDGDPAPVKPQPVPAPQPATWWGRLLAWLRKAVG